MSTTDQAWDQATLDRANAIGQAGCQLLVDELISAGANEALVMTVFVRIFAAVFGALVNPAEMEPALRTLMRSVESACADNGRAKQEIARREAQERMN